MDATEGVGTGTRGCGEGERPRDVGTNASRNTGQADTMNRYAYDPLGVRLLGDLMMQRFEGDTYPLMYPSLTLVAAAKPAG